MEKSVNTDNPQQTVSDLELGWLAGIIEGEGSIVLQVSKRMSRMQQIRLEPRVIITNTDMQIIERCSEILQKLGIGKWIMHKKPNNAKYGALVGKSYKEIAYLHITGFKRVSKLVGIMRRVMAGEKKVRCEALGNLIFHRMAHGGKNRPYDEKDIELILKFLSLTRTRNFEKIAGMLNEHTRDGRKRPETKLEMSAVRKAWWQKKREAEEPKMCSGLA